jgi:hypothetical protein
MAKSANGPWQLSLRRAARTVGVDRSIRFGWQKGMNVPQPEFDTNANYFVKQRYRPHSLVSSSCAMNSLNWFVGIG